MRLMTWCLGVLLLWSWHVSDNLHGAVPGWNYMLAWIFWFLVGLGALTVAVVRMVTGKVRAGAWGGAGVRRPHVPAEGKDE